MENKKKELLASLGINRYIMECKFICASDTSLADGELIDTLWNVNPLSTSLSLLPERAN